MAQYTVSLWPFCAFRLSVGKLMFFFVYANIIAHFFIKWLRRYSDILYINIRYAHTKRAAPFVKGGSLYVGV